jgi:hypothetical protein
MARSPAAEQLRQERETFDQARSQDRLWFGLRLAMGYVAIAIMVLVASVSLYVMLHPQRYGPAVLTLAAAALLVDWSAWPPPCSGWCCNRGAPERWDRSHR